MQINFTRHVSGAHQQGFSLVEIMVGIAIGLLGVLIIMQVSVVFEGQKRTTTTGSDAQTTGTLAFYQLERDVRRAGYGLSEPGVLGCTIKRYYDGKSLTDAVVTPLAIVNGEGGKPDTIQVLASAKNNWSVPNRIISEYAPTTIETFLNTTLGMSVGDILIAYEPGKDCTLFQITGPLDNKKKLQEGSLKVAHQRGAREGEGIWNPDDPAEVFPSTGYGVGALVFNLGSMIDHTYSLDQNGNLMVRNAGGEVRAIASDIVNLQAQYGFDTRAGIQGESIVDTWSDAMIDADKSGEINDAGDIARIAAVRMALVARSALKEKPNASGVCDITIAEAIGTRAPNAPTWEGGAIDVSKKPNGDVNPDWQCYRYKTIENVIPMRNLMWREQHAS